MFSGGNICEKRMGLAKSRRARWIWGLILNYSKHRHPELKAKGRPEEEVTGKRVAILSSKL